MMYMYFQFNAEQHYLSKKVPFLLDSACQCFLNVSKILGNLSLMFLKIMFLIKQKMCTSSSPCMIFQITLVTFFHSLWSFARFLRMLRYSVVLNCLIAIVDGFFLFLIHHCQSIFAVLLPSSLEFFGFSWTFEVLIHGLLTWCVSR